MTPSLLPGMIVIATSLRLPQVGYVVVFLHEGKEKIKRVSSIAEQGYFVLGDNQEFSTDSRHFGHLPHATPMATVIWPRVRRRD